jgi:hypothetical protein
VAVLAAVLLVVADFSTLSFRTIGIGACSDRVDPGVCRTVGHDSHSFVLVVVGLVALLMAWGAVVGRSRAASVAVAALGVVVLFIALAVDLPKLDDKRGLEVRYNDVTAHTGTAFKLELTGGVLLLLVGGLALVRAGSEGEPWQPRHSRPRPAGSSEPGDGDAEGDAEVSAAEARARERARRREARGRGGGSGAAVAEPPSSVEMPPPEPGTAATAPEREAAADSPTDPPDPGTAAEVDAPAKRGSAGPTDPPDPGTAADAAAPPEPDDAGPTGSGAPDRAAAAPADSDPMASPEPGELGPEAYRRPDAEPDPPVRG